MDDEHWFGADIKVVEMFLKVAVARYERGYLDPVDAGGAYDCTVLTPRTYEIKYDKRAGTTGKLYFETRNTYRQQPSGLTATTADAWAHYIPCRRCIAIYAPKRMLQFLEQELALCRTGYRRTQPNGGDQNSQGIVAPIEAILAQPFVARVPFTVRLPTRLPEATSVIGRCDRCGRYSAVEGMKNGHCQACQEVHA